MERKQISGAVFARLLDDIIDEANEWLEEEGKLADGMPPLSLEMSQSRLFGYGKFRLGNDYEKIDDPSVRDCTINAVLMRFCQQVDQQERLKNVNLNFTRLDARKLNDAYADYKNYLEDNTRKVTITDQYLALYLTFLGFDSLEEYQRARGQTPSENGLETYLYYRCHYFSDEEQAIVHFDATFTAPLANRTDMKVRFYGDHISTNYRGDIKTYEQEREAIITAWSQSLRPDRAHTSRPLIITITKQSDTPFHHLEICVGYYLNASKSQLENSCGIIIFEKLASEGADSRLNDRQLSHFLMHPPNSIPNGGFPTLAEFLKTYYEPYRELTRLAAEFNSRYYKAFLLSKKSRDHADVTLDHLEVSKFEFYAPYRVRCQSNYTTRTEFRGKVSFFLPNRIQIDMQGQLNSHYQIILEMPAASLDNNAPLKGVYSGMTQHGQIAAGRVQFHPLTPKEYDELTPRSFSLRSTEAQAWVNQYELESFFTGEQDGFVDNARAFKDQLTSIFEGSTNFQHLPGVYFYYRTRTIRGHMREIKRFPMLLRPDGEVVVKIKSGGEAQTAIGTAIRIKECIYIHLKKQDRYDGLAILWPPSLRNISPNDEIIPALYVSNSKRFHITAGRLFFVRQFSSSGDDEALFEGLEPMNIKVDDTNQLEQLSQKERVVTEILQGQLNNYMAVRDARELNLPDFRTTVFHGACYLATQGLFPQAFETLYLALLRAGFRELDTLRKAFNSGGPFAGQEEGFRKYCVERYDAIHGEDQRRYLDDLFEKIFPPS